MAVKKQFAVIVNDVTDSKNTVRVSTELITARTKAEAADKTWEKLEAELFDKADGTLTAEEAAALTKKSYRLKVELYRQLSAAGYDKPKVRAQKRAAARKKAAQKKAQDKKSRAGLKAA